MKRSLPFVGAAVSIVLSGTLLVWPLTNAEGRSAVVLAAALVLATQLPLHLLLGGWRSRNDRFVAVMVIGFFSRLALIVVGILVFVVPGRTRPGPFLLALGAFLVATLFAESILEQRHVKSSRTTAEA